MKNEWQKEIFKHREYWGRIVAIADDKIIAVADDYDEIRELASKITLKYGCYTVPKNPNEIRILTFKVRSLKKHDWAPNFPINFVLKNNILDEQKMLVDSGADISVINYQYGLSLGLIKEEHDPCLIAQGIGGSIDYIMKDIMIEINGYRFKNRFAWLQDPELNEMIIGREIVFDLFDIEFKQADEEIIFKKR
jgi:hypothetical protein